MTPVDGKFNQPLQAPFLEQTIAAVINEGNSGQITVGTVPAGCPVRAAYSLCKTAQGGAGWDIYVGDDTDPDGLLADAYVTKNAANAVGGVTPATLGDRLTDGTARKDWAPTSDTTIKAYVTAGSGAAGKVQVSVHYVRM